MTMLVQPDDLAGSRTEPDQGRPMLEVTVPVYNEQADLASASGGYTRIFPAAFPTGS